MSSKGFTLVEMMVATAMVGVLSSIAMPVYQGYITKTQVSEAFSAMEANKGKLSDSLIRKGTCSLGDTKTLTAEYGTLTVSGNLIANSLSSPKKVLKTGCVLTYKFNSKGTTKYIIDKTVVADFLSNSTLSKNVSSTVPVKFLPKAFKTLPVDTVDLLAAIPTPPARIPPPPFTLVPEVVKPSTGTIVDVAPGEYVDVFLVGGGGGGGGAVHNYSSSVWWADATGGNGGDTSVSISPLGAVLTAGGGRGGDQAHWGNGSSYSNGAGGDGGVVATTGSVAVFSNINQTNGIKPPTLSRWVRQLGGAPVTTVPPLVEERGGGGNGAWGVGDEQWSYGGGGGSGAAVSARITNNTGAIMRLTFTVGDGGAGWSKTAVTNGNPSDPGNKGYASVTFYK